MDGPQTIQVGAHMRRQSKKAMAKGYAFFGWHTPAGSLHSFNCSAIVARDAKEAGELIVGALAADFGAVPEKFPRLVWEKGPNDKPLPEWPADWRERAIENQRKALRQGT